MCLPKDFIVFDKDKIKDIPTDLLQEMKNRIWEEIKQRTMERDFPSFNEYEHSLSKVEAIKSYRNRNGFSLSESLIAWNKEFGNVK
ncbi:hypothetical protein KC723_03575 [Candidatus Kaiserbacteria bacterium]|nr:hypothetical protein [Candidatus Kaiserbacteria bacterium]